MAHEVGGLIERAGDQLRRRVAPRDKTHPEGGPLALSQGGSYPGMSGQAPLSSFALPTNPYRDLLRALRRHWLLAATVGAVVFAGVIGALLMMTPQYKAGAEVMIQPRRTEATKISPVMSSLPAALDTVTSELNVIKSPDLVLQLVKKLHLDARDEFDPNVPPLWKQAMDGVFQGVKSWLPSTIAEPLSVWLASPPLQGQARIDAVVALVTGRLDASASSYVINISFSSKDRELPNVVVNTLADLYIKNQFDMKRRASAEVNGWLSGDLAKLRENVDAAARRGAEYRAANGLIEGRDSSLIRQQISEVDTALTAARDQRMSLAAKLGNMTAPSSNTLVLSSPIIQELRRQQSTLATEETALNYNLGDRNPHLQSKNAQMANIERRIASETRKIVDSLHSDYNSAVMHENSLQNQLGQLKQEFARAQLAEVTLKQLDEQEKAARTLYNAYLERSNETEQANFELPDAVVISHAAAPLAPFSPKKKVILSLGFIVAAISGFLAALAVEKSDRSFRNQAQLERALGLPVLGILPEFTRNEDNRTPDLLSIVGSAMTDIYMRLNLDAMRCILAVSALPREGKTTAALMLARIAAINGKRVLVVDGDLRRSGLRARLHLPAVGLSELLAGKTGLAEAIVTDAQSVDIITCGGATDNPTALLASGAMRDFLSTMRRSYDLVIVDSPAIMAGHDAVILSRLVDQTLLLVRWARTPRTVAGVALRRLAEGGARGLAAILSRTDLRNMGRYSDTDALSYSRAMRRYYPVPR